MRAREIRVLGDGMPRAMHLRWRVLSMIPMLPASCGTVQGATPRCSACSKTAWATGSTLSLIRASSRCVSRGAVFLRIADPIPSGWSSMPGLRRVVNGKPSPPGTSCSVETARPYQINGTGPQSNRPWPSRSASELASLPSPGSTKAGEPGCCEIRSTSSFQVDAESRLPVKGAAFPKPTAVWIRLRSVSLSSSASTGGA